MIEIEISLPARGRLEKGLDHVNDLLPKLGRSLIEAERDIDHVTVLFRIDLKKGRRRDAKGASNRFKG